MGILEGRVTAAEAVDTLDENVNGVVGRLVVSSTEGVVGVVETWLKILLIVELKIFVVVLRCPAGANVTGARLI